MYLSDTVPAHINSPCFTFMVRSLYFHVSLACSQHKTRNEKSMTTTMDNAKARMKRGTGEEDNATQHDTTQTTKNNTTLHVDGCDTSFIGCSWCFVILGVLVFRNPFCLPV
jgi:hypothetical protein